ncbi:YbdK family carboxylate-amine ligase [Leucobacter sp. NPDC015123]|uniref:carboxylate-amine ligase n=1 Tax=Leucobacter sp. NPDC015123 TaxID=3364129 RepID=UPI0036F4516F
MSSSGKRLIGIEEEFALVDPATGTPVAGSAARVIREVSDEAPVEHEFLDSQVEIATPPCETADQAEESLFQLRGRTLAAARNQGALLAATATPPAAPDPALVSHVTGNERYLEIAQGARKVAQTHYINGQHVHVSVAGPAEGVRVINGLARWAPLLLAMTANSPIWDGADTGFRSWRHVIGCAWPLNMYPAHFASVDDYDRRVDRLVRSGLILDRGLVTWVARLSARYPTVELRVADVQLNPRHAVAFALIVRALVTTIAAAPNDDPQLSGCGIDADEVNVSLWFAARDGLTRTLVDPLDCREVAATDWLDELVGAILPALDEAGDTERVREYVADLKANGVPADAQRRALAAGGIAQLLELFAASHLRDIGAPAGGAPALSAGTGAP